MIKHEIKLVVGLGNPGLQYSSTRHNIGAEALEVMNRYYKLGSWHNKFHGDYLRGEIDEKQLIFLRPLTYMNLSGRSVMECMRFFKLLPSNILVLQDDLDLRVGKLKVKIGGGHGGHNGLRSIDEMLGSKEYYRLRIGIDHPEDRDQVSNYVLAKFTTEEQNKLQPILQAMAVHLPLLLSGHSDRFIELVTKG